MVEEAGSISESAGKSLAFRPKSTDDFAKLKRTWGHANRAIAAAIEMTIAYRRKDKTVLLGLLGWLSG